ncbi:MAG TPA: tripartite tricarboxylate transporter TctB family protein [Burkholderiales bacterium]
MRLSQPLASAIFFFAFGALVLVTGRSLDMGTTAEMGTGYVPRLLAWGCLVVGALLAARAWWERRAPGEPVAFALRALVLVTAMVVAFGLLLPWLGLPVTVALTIVTTAVSGERYRWTPLLLIALGMAVLTTLLFSTALDLQIQVWPKWGG